MRKRQARRRIFRALQAIFRFSDPGATHPEEIVIQREVSSTMWKAVSALGEKQRLPLIFYYYDNLPVSEIALVLNLPEGTVLSRLHTARERLHLTLGEASANDVPGKDTKP